MPKSCPGTTTRADHAAAVVRRPALAAGLLVTLLLGTAACGSEGGAQQPSKATLECRSQWEKLATEVDEGDSGTTPSDLASRWNGVSAAVAHYSGAASSKDCGTTIEDEEKAIEDLRAFSKTLAPFDMEDRLAQVRDGAEEYAESPQPTPPAPSPTKGPTKGPTNSKGKKATRPSAPRPAEVATALKFLTEQAPIASKQQGPGWQQASVVELSDATAVAKAVKDLAFLSSQSEAYQACLAALATIEAAALAAMAD